MYRNDGGGSAQVKSIARVRMAQIVGTPAKPVIFC